MKLNLNSGLAGLLGSILAIFSLMIVVLLGLYQPEYNHFTNTISALVAGELGWIQTLNFFILALSIVLIGYGLGKSFTKQNHNSVFSVFTLFAFFTILIAFIPTDMVNSREKFHFSQLSPYGMVHYFFVLAMLIVIPFLLFHVLNKMKAHQNWQTLVPLTKLILGFNLIVGFLWYGLVSFGYLSDWKGLVQKILAANVIIWLTMIGHKLWRLEVASRLKAK